MGWFIQDSTVGIVTWAGTLLTIMGLLFTFFAAQAARKASENAESAARKAVDLLEGKLNIANVAFSYSQVGVVMALVNDGSLRAAQIIFHALHRTVEEALHLLRLRPELAGQLAVTRRNLAKVETQLVLGIASDPRYDAATASNALKSIARFLVMRENELKF
jgi:hypothetical protein